MLSKAIQLRKAGNAAAAERLLVDLVATRPMDPDVHYQLACIYDTQGKEGEAIPHYRKALELGLRDDRSGAWLGLGSSYRNIGMLAESEETLRHGLAEDPTYRPLAAFLCLTLNQAGRRMEALKLALSTLADAANDDSMTPYRRVLHEYIDELK